MGKIQIETSHSTIAGLQSGPAGKLLLTIGCMMFALCGGSASAFAASVMLIPVSATSNLQNEQVVTIDVVIDFSAEGGTLGGGLNIMFDPTSIVLVDLTTGGIGDPPFSREPDDFGDVLADWAIGSFNGVSDSQAEIIGTVQFQVLPDMGADTLITVSATNGIGGPWISGLDFLSQVSPQYNQVELTRAFIKDGFED